MCIIIIVVQLLLMLYLHSIHVIKDIPISHLAKASTRHRSINIHLIWHTNDTHSSCFKSQTFKV